MVRSCAAFERIYDNELLGLSAVRQVNVNVVSMALARTTAERNEIAERLGRFRADLRKQLEVARPSVSLGGAHALFVAAGISVRRYAETIQEAIDRRARAEPARHKELVTEQCKAALSEDFRRKRTLMLALCAASVVVCMGLGVRLACGSAAGSGVAGSIEPEAAPGWEGVHLPHAADLELHTPAREGASR